MYRKFFALFLSLLLLAGCSSEKITDKAENKDQLSQVKSDILSLSSGLDGYSAELISAEFLDWLGNEMSGEVLLALRDSIANGDFSVETWHSITGNSAVVLHDMYTGVLDKDDPNYRDNIKVLEVSGEDTAIRIVGDVSFADNWKIIPAMESREKGIYGVLSEETVALLKDADIFLANNEFTYSTRGTPLPNKAFTFRAAPKRVNHMKEIGTDIVSLANNHAYDYGADAFTDTMQILSAADIPYIGGGANIEEASKPYYFIVNGRKYAFSAATRAEKNILTPEAKENSSGVMRTYDPTEYIKVIQTAEKDCDYNIVYVHWGAEGSHQIEDGLYEMGQQFIDAGADIVVGAHAHILQGIQFYKGVPIVYNLGNFIFNSETIDTGILEINISFDGTPTYKFIPAIQKDCYTRLADGGEKQRILDFMESLSIGVRFDESGFFTEK